jgi:hypothetical protein
MEALDKNGRALNPGDAIKTPILNPSRHALKEGAKVIGYIREVYTPIKPEFPMRGRVAFAVHGGQVTEYFNVHESELLLTADGQDPNG